MNLFGMMDASGGAMQAERVRAEVVAANMANAETTRTATGGPYHRQHVVFAADSGDTKFLDSMNTASGGTIAGSSPGSGSSFSAVGSTGGVAVAPLRSGPSRCRTGWVRRVSRHQPHLRDGRFDGRNARLWNEQLSGAG